jgi:hypothetical protein
MTAISNEIRKDSVEVTPEGVTVIVHNVPTRVLKDEFGREHEGHSIGVAMRLEELTNRALEEDSSPGAVHELEF